MYLYFLPPGLQMDHFLVRERHLIFLFSSSVFSLKNFIKSCFLLFFSVFFSFFLSFLSLTQVSSFVRVRNFFVVLRVCAFFFIRDRERERKEVKFLSFSLSSRNTFFFKSKNQTQQATTTTTTTTTVINIYIVI